MTERIRRVACIGLGRMGNEIGKHLAAYLAGGADGGLRVFDADPTTLEAWRASAFEQVSVSDSIAQAVQGADCIVSSLPADAALRQVVEQALPGLQSGAVWIDHSTTSAGVARQLAQQLAPLEVEFLDAPVSGGVDGARNGTLTVMVGGCVAALGRIGELVDQYAARVTHMGPAGAGQLTKMTNQICVIGLCQALAEGLDFAGHAGLDTDKVVQVMLQGSSASWQMQHRAETMIKGQYDFGFSTTLMRKDIGLLAKEAAAMGVDLPVTGMVAGFLDEVDAMGGADWDWSSLMERQRRQG